MYRIWQQSELRFAYSNVHPNTISQPPFPENLLDEFTGFLDKRNKKIFVGDIVKYNSEAPAESFEATVVYENSEFYFGWLKLKCVCQANIEVVGNVREFFEVRKNKELKAYDGELQCGFPAKFNSITYARLCRDRLRTLDHSNWSIYYQGVKYEC